MSRRRAFWVALASVIFGPPIALFGSYLGAVAWEMGRQFAASGFADVALQTWGRFLNVGGFLLFAGGIVAFMLGCAAFLAALIFKGVWK